MAAIRVLHFIYDHPANPWVGGGGAVRAIEINRRLAGLGHHVDMYCGNFPGAEAHVVDEAMGAGRMSLKFTGLASGYVASTFSYAAAAAGLALRLARRYDVVVEDFAPWNPLFTPLFCGRPAVIHVNHSEGFNILRRYPGIGLGFYLADRYYPRLYRHVTALSEGTRTKIRVPGALVLPAGLPEAVVRSYAPPAGGHPDGGYVLYVGRLEINNKGLDTLMAALRLSPGMRLVIAGRGRDEDRLRRMADGLDVTFAGFVSEERKAELLKGARLFVLPSRFEGWGIVILEAAACGKPVLVSDIPELSYATGATGGGFGLSFRKADAASLAEKLGELMGDAALRARLGAQALQFAQRYTWESVARMYEEYLVREALSRPP